MTDNTTSKNTLLPHSPEAEECAALLKEHPEFGRDVRPSDVWADDEFDGDIWTDVREFDV